MIYRQLQASLLRLVRSVFNTVALKTRPKLNNLGLVFLYNNIDCFLLSFTAHMSIGLPMIAGLVPFGLPFTNPSTSLVYITSVYTIGVYNQMVLT